MNKKIFTLLMIFIATISVVSVCASEELVSHDFGKFNMDIYDGQTVSDSSGSVGQSILLVVLDNPFIILQIKMVVLALM